MNRINLDDFGNDRFAKDELEQLMSWYGKRKVNPKKYRAKFNLGYGYRDDTPFVFLTRLADWRRMERVYNKTQQLYHAALTAKWDYMKFLWDQVKQEVPEGFKNMQGMLLQELEAPSKRKKKVSPYLLVVEKSRYGGKESLSTTHKERKEFKDGQDARMYWGWLGTKEEERFNELRRWEETRRRQHGFAQNAFREAVKIRLAAWWKHRCDELGHAEWEYSQRKVFVAVENEGRSYGWVTGMGGPSELVWSPEEPPTFFI
jgi:hypothetical protein